MDRLGDVLHGLLDVLDRLHWLLDVLHLLHWLLDVLYWLDSDRLSHLGLLVHDLPLHRVVLDALLVAVHRHVLCILLLEDLRNVFSLVFDGIVVGHPPLLGDVLDNFLFLVLHDGSLVGDILDPGFTLD